MFFSLFVHQSVLLSIPFASVCWKKFQRRRTVNKLLLRIMHKFFPYPQIAYKGTKSISKQKFANKIFRKTIWLVKNLSSKLLKIPGWSNKDNLTRDRNLSLIRYFWCYRSDISKIQTIYRIGPVSKLLIVIRLPKSAVPSL